MSTYASSALNDVGDLTRRQTAVMLKVGVGLKQSVDGHQCRNARVSNTAWISVVMVMRDVLEMEEKEEKDGRSEGGTEGGTEGEPAGRHRWTSSP